MCRVSVSRYDPAWPKLPLPNQWILGEVGGIGVDPKGHVFVIQRPWTVIDRELAALTGEAECCRPAPPVIEFDATGNVVQSWPPLRSFKAGPGARCSRGISVGLNGQELWEAGPGPYGEWGRREHTVYVDHKDNVWVSNDDSHVIYKFTRQGKHLLTIGKHNVTKGSNDTQHLGRPAGLVVDPQANELYVADGYTNKRVIVFDAETGAYRRHWGAYGARPEDTKLPPYDPAAPPAKQFHGPVHGITLSARRAALRDRSHRQPRAGVPQGRHLRQGRVRLAEDAGCRRGCTGVALSTDPEQRWAYINDGSNNKIWILRRDTLATVGSFGSYGRFGGQVFSAHSMAVDQQGNIYVGETRGRRVQRFKLISGGR